MNSEWRHRWPNSCARVYHFHDAMETNDAPLAREAGSVPALELVNPAIHRSFIGVPTVRHLDPASAHLARGNLDAIGEHLAPVLRSAGPPAGFSEGVVCERRRPV